MAECGVLVLDMPIQAKQLTREKIDLGLAALAMDWQLTVVFIGEGVWQLLNPQLEYSSKTKDYCAALGLFEMYGVDHLYVSSEDLSERDLSPMDLRFSVQRVSKQSIHEILCAADHLL